MNRKIHLAALCLLLSAAPSLGQTVRTWSLKDCIDHALAHNIQLRRARLSAQSSATDVKEAKAGLLPTLSAAVTQSVQYRPFQEQTGITNGTRTEIISGLPAGAQVIVEMKDASSVEENTDAATERSPFAPGPPDRGKNKKK